VIRIVFRLLLLACVPVATAAAITAESLDSISMRTVEGQVVSVTRQKGEGNLDLLVAQLAVTGESKEILEILLAPDHVCDAIGFQVSEGDRLRARIFVEAEGPARVQKIQNFSQGTMVRLRTLHRIPLWNTSGVWQGGPIRTAHGPHRNGPAQRGPGGPPR
jgi:hypothetical protein